MLRESEEDLLGLETVRLVTNSVDGGGLGQLLDRLELLLGEVNG
jgi:hypothetical protein